MLNFKLQLEGLPEHVQLLSSYDDLRYVKSNPDVAVRFKQFYEGKSCVVNIKDVNDNKVYVFLMKFPFVSKCIIRNQLQHSTTPTCAAVKGRCDDVYLPTARCAGTFRSACGACGECISCVCAYDRYGGENGRAAK